MPSVLTSAKQGGGGNHLCKLSLSHSISLPFPSTCIWADSGPGGDGGATTWVGSRDNVLGGKLIMRWWGSGLITTWGIFQWLLMTSGGKWADSEPEADPGTTTWV